ncbi:M61 family metallopeptidase [Thalassotalea atypica]|uniref:M61 family metallopeptidase n=1 Tax=Thalassotalea atypica TaxID=2054316 RepID=UPI0025724133|nr:PDZ domain-containing protein [Thalassotalea atypica]
MSHIQYSIVPSTPNSHLFSVSLCFDTTVNETYTLALPAWLPGSYMVRDFAKNIVEIFAVDSKGNALPLNQTDKQTWQITAIDEKTVVEYQVFAFDLSVRSAYLDSERGFFNGSSTFLEVKELKDTPCHLSIKPAIDKPNWRVATGLNRSSTTDKFSFGEYIADDYQQLIDCPVAIGEFDCTEFVVEGVTHHLVFTSAHYGDAARLARDVAKLCQHHINLFGEAPFKEYWFITHLLESGFGGLEHKNSTILQASRFDLPNPQKPTELSDNYKTFLSLCSHEYFHAWNVCRIKPKELTPYDLSQEVYTEQLWAYEGITSYYDDFSLYRTGIIPFEDYLALLGKTATRVYRGKGETKQSVSQSSFNTWNKFYKQGPDAVNNIVSYYTKGSLIALWLDLTIRQHSAGSYSLDTLMKELWIHFGRPSIGTQTEDFVNIANILCNKDISDSFNELLHSAHKLDLSDMLTTVGIKVNHVKFKKLNGLETINSSGYQPFLGAQYQVKNTGLKISSVQEDSPAALAGLAVGDLLLAVNNLKVTDSSLQKLAEHLPENQLVDCVYFRDDQLMQTQLAFIDCPAIGIAFEVTDQELVSKWQQH